MQLDPDNYVVKLCVAGMQAEDEQRFDDARALFTQAWDARQNDLDACIAAHYMARHQPTLERILHWNQAALRYADAVSKPEGEQAANPHETGDPHENSIRGFYPSLYLNVGNSYADLGDFATARHYYQLAEKMVKKMDEERLEALSGDYGDVVRHGVAAGLQRTLPT